MKKTILILMLAMLLVVSACENNNEGPSNRETYIGGNQGLELSFAPDAPPETTADNDQQQFDIIVELRNRGEDAVAKEEANVKISGIPLDAFGVTKSDLERNPEDDMERRIKNADGTVVEPVMVEAIFSDLAYQYSEPGNQQFPLRAEVCYLYETNVASSLCVKEKMTSTDDDDICTINSARPVSSSGAPVQITSIKQSGAGADKTRFTFTIANVDKGRIFKDTSSCESSTSVENRIWVEVDGLLERGGASSVSCTGLRDGTDDYSGYIILSGGTPSTFSCAVTIPESERTNRVQPFNIKLGYNYWDFIETDILVQYTPEE